MSETIRLMIDKMSEKGVRTNLLTVISLCIAVVVIVQRVDRWEESLSRMERDTWRVSDQVEYAHQFKEANPSATVPDAVKIVQQRHSLSDSRYSMSPEIKTE